MAILYTPAKRFTDPLEKVTYQGLAKISPGIAIVEPETVGAREWITSEITTLVKAVPTGTSAVFTKVTDAVVAAGATVLFSDSTPAPVGSTINDVVVPDQRYTNVYFSCYIEMQTSLDGVTAPFIRWVARNHHGATSQTITNGATIRYTVLSGTGIAQARSPNTQLTVTSTFAWLDTDGEPLNQPVSVDGLNLTALPLITVENDSLTATELNSEDVSVLAAANSGDRVTFIKSGATAVPVGSAVTLGTATITGLTVDHVVLVAQPQASPIFTAYIPSSNTITLQARNNAFSTVTVPSGLQLRLIAI